MRLVVGSATPVRVLISSLCRLGVSTDMGETNDQRLLGGLEASVNHLKESVDTLTLAMGELSDRIGAIEIAYKVVKGKAWGIGIGAIFALYGLKEAAQKLAGMLGP
jgi:tetrahydromethanopterin S-methyltransferase subunit B